MLCVKALEPTLNVGPIIATKIEIATVTAAPARRIKAEVPKRGTLDVSESKLKSSYVIKTIQIKLMKAKIVVVVNNSLVNDADKAPVVESVTPKFTT